jgi:uncharacterized protein YjbI with pentapeptide repeats/menaquinone-dependent protoporphyrinogen IX oxidase
MDQKIIVCYATGSGSTGEVAEFIAKELESANVAVEVQKASNVTNLDAYSGVVLGSSVRFGRWLSDAIEFLDRFSDALIDRPVAFFMTCLTIIENSESAQQTAQAYWEPILQRIPGVDPIGLGLFAGSLALELGQLPEYQDSPYGDYRDWDAIRAWVNEIRPALLAGKPRTKMPLVLSGTILSYTDLSGNDLTRFDFRDSELAHARLREAKLQEADLRRAKLQATDLRGADFSQAHLGWADLREAQCQGADFSKANLIGVNLEGANLQEAALPYAILNGSTLSHANLRQADLQGTDLNWADLQGADLTGANLIQAHLGWANLTDAQLSEAHLEAARYNSHTRWPAGFSPEQAGCILVENAPL